MVEKSVNKFACIFAFLKSTKMKIIKKILLFIVIIALAVLAFLYFGTYSEGTRAGIIMKVSKKGTIFKTWEGQMNLETFGAVKTDNIVSETFSFSIEKGNQQLIDDLNAAALSGDRVNLKYKQRYIKVAWRGESKYFAVGVERGAGGGTDKEEKFPRH
jgi:hypothetical protein